ncbi:MAG: hypothetical protein C0403_03170 [Desulfobacterium sp.]|nr:hypothetical protein [Desulfobacterium sp.]
MSQKFKSLKNDKETKLQDILQVALKMFARYGYKKTTIEDIAQEMGMTKSNIYFYVANKKDLYEKTVGNELIQWRDTIGREVEQVEDIVEKFRIMVSRAFEYLFSHKDLHTIVVNDPGIFTLSRDQDRFLEINLGAMQVIRMVLQQGVSQGRFYPVDIDVTTDLLFSIYIMFLIKTSVASEIQSVSRMVEAGTELILRGLCAP